MLFHLLPVIGQVGRFPKIIIIITCIIPVRATAKTEVVLGEEFFTLLECFFILVSFGFMHIYKLLVVFGVAAIAGVAQRKVMFSEVTHFFGVQCH